MFVREHTHYQWKTFKLRKRVSSSLIEYPIKKALYYIYSLTKGTSWKHTHI